MQMSKAELIEASHPIAGAHRRMARRTAESRFQMGRSSFTRLDQKPGANLRSHAVRFAENPRHPWSFFVCAESGHCTSQSGSIS